MKKILPFIILIGILISVNSTYACMPFEASTYVYFKPGSGVNMTMLENYCRVDSCIIENSKIIYRSHFDSNIVIEVSKENVSNLELSRLGIIIPTNGTKFEGLSIRVDVANLSNSQILDLLKTL